MLQYVFNVRQARIIEVIILKKRFINKHNGIMEERIHILIAKKLTGEATDTEIQELEQWAGQSAENDAALIEAEELWLDSDKLFTQPKFDTVRGWERVSAKMNATVNVAPAGKRVIFSPGIKTTIAAAAILLIGFFIVNTIQDLGDTEIIASNGNKEVVLPDNTVVTLYKGSSLSYGKNFDKKLREVTLNGDAFFDVARNEEKPFIISAGEVDVQVLGTSFYTKSGVDAYVAVVTGKVQMSKKDNAQAKLILTPGETGALYNGSLVEELTDVSDLMYWETGSIKFEDVALEQLVTRLDKIFAEEIRLSENLPQEIRSQVININFAQQSLPEMLEELCMVSKCSLKKSDNGYTIAQ